MFESASIRGLTLAHQLGRSAFIVVLAWGLAGCEGPTGPGGEHGNANVRSYEFSVLDTDWGNNLHYGDSNNFRAFTVDPDLVGGTSINTFFNEGGGVLVYVRPTDAYDEWMMTPQVYRDSFGEGMRIECIPTRSSITLSRTLNGWEHLSVPTLELPPEIQCRIVLIEATEFASSMAGPSPLDLSNYASVAKRYGLEPIPAER